MARKLGLFPARAKIKSNQIKSNQIKSNQIKSNQIKSNQIKSNQIKSNQIKSNQIKSNQIKSNQIKSNQIRSNQIKSESFTNLSHSTSLLISNMKDIRLIKRWYARGCEIGKQISVSIRVKCHAISDNR